jgi:hypothetical protein
MVMSVVFERLVLRARGDIGRGLLICGEQCPLCFFISLFFFWHWAPPPFFFKLRSKQAWVEGECQKKYTLHWRRKEKKKRGKKKKYEFADRPVGSKSSE